MPDRDKYKLDANDPLGLGADTVIHQSEVSPVPVAVVHPETQNVNVTNLPRDLSKLVKPNASVSDRSKPSPAPSLPPTTTLEEDVRTAAQRELNMTWENTQALISKVVIFTMCVGVIVSVVVKAIFPERAIILPSEFWAIVGLVIGFYFGRTNHARTTGTSIHRSTTNNANMDSLDDRNN